MRRPHLLPAPLRPGDTVAVVAPAGPVDATEMSAARSLLEGWGLRVRSTPRLFSTRLGYLAGPDEDRLEDLTEAWLDPEVRGVFCARGGYGTQRIADRLDYPRLAAAGPKFLVGSSDITCLHQAWGDRLGLVTLHGPMPACRPLHDDEETARHLHAALFGPSARSLPLTGPVLVPGRAEGRLTGGNLSLLASSTGTRTAPDTEGCVLFLEDVGEDPYRLDRALTQLRRADVLQRTAGVVLGDFSACGPPEQVEGVLRDRLSDLGVPVAAGLPAGHGPRQLTLPLGADAVLDTARHRVALPSQQRTPR
ncbi:LD-carboxypeptidase [Streptomyces sp. NBC_00233]|uniref:S66 peptidase family protein n=1 Tax=Streptomyces sp. NBC_00233 TaxID=2975686 RepID=UPI00225AAFB6|nr:LD-carboxypeptidase [Streptomyces sp. NBC_00233]MCX5232898.1 LD-carboxypeptidase [Streptomyces sp. NBC_00233]